MEIKNYKEQDQEIWLYRTQMAILIIQHPLMLKIVKYGQINQQEPQKH